MDSHEFSGEIVSYLDDNLEAYLRWMKQEGFLNNTVIMLYSDHGNHINFVLKESIYGYTELSNPFLFMSLPENVAGKFGDNLVRNENKMATHYDIHESTLHLIDKKGISNGTNFFKDVINSNRTCKSVGVVEECACKNQSSWLGLDW
jgi:phosphoglycerol transferase MdoB-like AlkP superfamily enzyme